MPDVRTIAAALSVPLATPTQQVAPIAPAKQAQSAEKPAKPEPAKSEKFDPDTLTHSAAHGNVYYLYLPHDVLQSEFDASPFGAECRRAEAKYDRIAFVGPGELVFDLPDPDESPEDTSTPEADSGD